MDDDLLRNALQELKEQGHEVVTALGCSNKHHMKCHGKHSPWLAAPTRIAVVMPSAASAAHIVRNFCNSTLPILMAPFPFTTAIHACVSCACVHSCMQVSVRVTFDRGDVEHFISEAIHLNDVGITNYQTVVAGEPGSDCG